MYSRLVNDINVPFQLDKDAVRRGETHVHEALREALVNTLIHADHQSTRPIVVTKFPNYFLFSNPGRLRISVQQLYQGGISDPRNPNLQKMFQMLGLGEKAGSGFWEDSPRLERTAMVVPFGIRKIGFRNDISCITNGEPNSRKCRERVKGDCGG